MTLLEARSVLDATPAIAHPCDLDLLVFFRRHPLALLTSEQLTAVVGYSRERVAQSLDVLTGAALLSRSANPSHAARLFALERGEGADRISPLLDFVSTRPGRREMIAHLNNRASNGAVGGARTSASVTPIAKKAA